MHYNIQYHVISAEYNDVTRLTTVRIINDNTGEVFKGKARRHPKDGMNSSLAFNLATLRAVKKAIEANLEVHEKIISEGELTTYFHA